MVPSIKDNMEIDGGATISMCESTKDDKHVLYFVFILFDTALCLKKICFHDLIIKIGHY